MSQVKCHFFFLVKFVNLVSGRSFDNAATPSSLSRLTCLTESKSTPYPYGGERGAGNPD